MRYVRATTVGVATGLLAAVVWIALTVVLPVGVQIAQQMTNDYGVVSRVTFTTLPLTLILVLGFILGFALSLRRGRRKAAL